MKIRANNAMEVLLYNIALAGEIPKNFEFEGIKNSTLQNAITKAKQNKLITIDKTHKRIRLENPNGLELLRALSPAMFLHYMLISNEHKFARDKNAIGNIKDRSQATLFMMKENIAIDNLSIEYIPNSFGKTEEENDELDTLLGGSSIFRHEGNSFMEDDHVADLITATKNLPPNERWFFSTRFIKINYALTNKIIGAQPAGILLNDRQSYVIYYTSNINKKLVKQYEEQYIGLIEGLIENAYQKSNPAQAIFMIDGNVFDFFRQHRIAMGNLYQDAFVIPPDHNLFNLLMKENWKDELQTVLYGNPSDQIYDGVVDGLPSWELLSGDYQKIYNIKRIANNNPVHFLCFEWQAAAVKQMVRPMNATILTLSTQEEDALWNVLKIK